jgi:hypothetical protein
MPEIIEQHLIEEVDEEYETEYDEDSEISLSSKKSLSPEKPSSELAKNRLSSAVYSRRRSLISTTSFYVS